MRFVGGVERQRCLCAFLFSPHAIGKSEELRESELSYVGRKIGETFGNRRWDEGCVSGGGRAGQRRRRVLSWNRCTRPQKRRPRIFRARFWRAKICRPPGAFAAAVLRAEPGSDRSSGQVPGARRRLRPVSHRRRSGAGTADFSRQHSAFSSQRASSSVIRMKLDGANSSAHISGTEPLPGKSSYFIGNDPSKWRHDIPQFARVEYQAVYPGVDLVYYGNQGQLEYDFRVAPGADPNQIALSFEGASAHIISLSGDSGDSGDLILSTDQGDVRFHAPKVYQPATPESGSPSGNAPKTIAGS